MSSKLDRLLRGFLFPSLPRQFVHEDFIVALASDFGTVVPGSVRLSAGPPRVQLFVSSDIPDSILVTGRGDYRFTQRIVVTGRPGQCLRCHEMGHLVRHCPTLPAPRQQQRAYAEQQRD